MTHKYKIMQFVREHRNQA